jgi:hypothetical protein
MRHARLLARLCLIAAAIALALASGATAVVFAPPLLLFALLLRGRYVGEEQILRVVRAVRRRSARRAASRRIPPRARRARGAAPRGGLLIACSLAVRPPPSRLPA